MLCERRGGGERSSLRLDSRSLAAGDFARAHLRANVHRAFDNARERPNSRPCRHQYVGDTAMGAYRGSSEAPQQRPRSEQAACPRRNLRFIRMHPHASKRVA
eukprot:3360808-Pleurochrysis_carterae.AAC.3